MKLIEDEGLRVKKLIINIIVLVIALRGVSKYNVEEHQSPLFDRLIIDSLAPMQSSVTYLKRKFSSIFEYYVMNVNASKENTELKKKISVLNGHLFQFEELAEENKRIKELLQFGKEIPMKKVLAQIVAWDAASDYKVLRINKGSADGLKLQSTVVTSKGLVGYVYRLTNHFADILTILDSNNRVDGLIKRIRSHGIVEGHSGEKCVMKYVTRTEPVILNDLVLTSGLGNIYPKGLKIGRVTRIERESYGITQYIEITPSVDFGRLEEVIVLVSPDDKRRQLEWEALDNPEPHED